MIKINGIWKDVPTIFIKIQGVWKSVTTEYIKVQGKWRDLNQVISGLHPEQYYYEAKPEVKQDLLVLSDIGQLPQVDAKLNGSFHIHLGAGQSVPYPIVHQSGSELGDTDFSGSQVYMGKGGDTDIVAEECVFNGSGAYIYYSTLEIGETYRASVKVNRWTSGNALRFGDSATGGGTEYGAVTRVAGETTTIEFVAGTDTLGIGTASFTADGAIDNISIKKITTPNSYISYYDVDTRQRVQPTTTVSTTYNMTASHSGYATHTKALTPAELEEVNTGINVMAEVWFDGRVLVDGFSKSDTVNFFDPNGDDKYIQDLSVELGSENYDGIITVGTAGIVTVTDLGSGDWNITHSGTDINNISFGTLVETTQLSSISFYADIHEGEIWFTASRVDSGNYFFEHIVTQGINNIYLPTTRGSKTEYYLYTSSLPNHSSFNIDFKGVSIKELIGYAEIQNYTTACRPAPTNHGATNFLLEMDGIRATGIAPANQLQGGDDGRNIQVGTDIHLIKDCVTVIKGDDPTALIEVDCTPAPSTRIAFSSGFSNGFK